MDYRTASFILAIMGGIISLIAAAFLLAAGYLSSVWVSGVAGGLLSSLGYLVGALSLAFAIIAFIGAWLVRKQMRAGGWLLLIVSIVYLIFLGLGIGHILALFAGVVSIAGDWRAKKAK